MYSTLGNRLFCQFTLQWFDLASILNLFRLRDLDLRPIFFGKIIIQRLSYDNLFLL